MKNLNLLLVQLLLCLFLPFNSYCQENGSGSISGKLTDSITGQPLEFATVAILEKETKQAVGGSITNENGEFRFENLKPGNYDFLASFIGYSTVTIPVSITAAKPNLQLGTLKLAPEASELGEVTIQTLRPQIIQLADRIVVNVEGSVMAAGNSAFEVLAKTPGVFIDQEGNIQLNGRSGVTVMLNDKLTYLSARDLKVMLESMSADNIKNIEIISNPSAKYDAEGSSGILNINLKRNAQQGINGSLNTSYNYNGKQHGYSAGARVNYKAGDWNSFVNLDFSRRVGGREATFTRVFFGDEETTYFDQVATGNYVAQGPPAVRAGVDYNLSENHSIGVMGNFTTNTFESDFLTDTFIGNSPGQPDLFIDANNFQTNTYKNYTANIHYTGKLDTLGTSISSDVDFVKIRNEGESNFLNYYDNLNTGDPVVQDFLYTNTPNGYDIYSAKVDFAKGFRGGSKFETGVKASRVESDNDSQFYFNNNGLVLDPLRTNHFVYDENILAAYVNYNRSLGKKFQLQAGLRAENTSSRGESLTTGEVTKRNYLDFFPSVFLQQNVTENYGINYSYSRRIQRPNYGNLNPFISYRDPFTYIQGNPGLRPQYTHAFGLTQTYKKTYSLALNYQLVKDVISELPILVEETATTIYTTGNVDDSQNISMTAMAPVKILKNWDTNNTLIVSYNEFNIFVDGTTLENDQLFYMLQSNHNILLPKKFKMEINAAYRGPAASGLYRIAPMWWVHAGIKKSFLKDKLELGVNVNDIFKSTRLVFTTNIGDNINDFDQYFRNRNVVLSLRYNFSTGLEFKAKQRENKLEEVNRT